MPSIINPHIEYKFFLSHIVGEYRFKVVPRTQNKFAGRMVINQRYTNTIVSRNLPQPYMYVNPVKKAPDNVSNRKKLGCQGRHVHVVYSVLRGVSRIFERGGVQYLLVP